MSVETYPLAWIHRAAEDSDSQDSNLQTFGSCPLKTLAFRASAGLAAGAALVGYETDLASLAAMGAVSGAFLGAGQGLVLAAQGRQRLAVAWGTAMPAIGWSATQLAGVDVDKQFTVFGAAGAVTFMLLSGLLLARFMPAQGRVP